MKKILISVLIGLGLTLVSCEENKDALTYIERNSNTNKVEEVKEAKPILNNTTTTKNNNSNTENYTLNDYMNLRLWFDVLDGENGIDKEEASVLNNLCNNHEDFKIFEEALENSIYKLYPDLNN